MQLGVSDFSINPVDLDLAVSVSKRDLKRRIWRRRSKLITGTLRDGGV